MPRHKTTKQLNIAVSPAQLETVARLASINKLSKSDFVRSLLAQAAENVGLDWPADLQPVGASTKRARPIYLALTTINAQQSGWFVMAAGHNEKMVLNAALEVIGDSSDIYAVTERANLRVVSKTRARRYGVYWDSLIIDGWERYRWVD